MSQAKVDRYKLEKANRKEIMAKQKSKQRRQKAVTGVVVAAFVGWIGFSAYDMVISAIPREVVTVDFASMDTYLETMAE